MKKYFYNQNSLIESLKSGDEKAYGHLIERLLHFKLTAPLLHYKRNSVALMLFIINFASIKFC